MSLEKAKVMSFNPLPFRSEGMGLIMSQTASESLISDPNNCLSVGAALVVGTSVAVGVAFGVAAAFTATPLFHTKRVPDLTQVNFFPPEIEVAPAFVHFAPAFTAASAEVPLRISVPTISGVKAWMLLRMLKVKPSQCTFSRTLETKT
jgi:hypothetical protein